MDMYKIKEHTDRLQGQHTPKTKKRRKRKKEEQYIASVSAAQANWKVDEMSSNE